MRMAKNHDFILLQIQFTYVRIWKKETFFNIKVVCSFITDPCEKENGLN